MIISKEEFKTKLVNALKREAGPKETVEIRTVMKNNGVMWDGLMIHQADSRIAPTIYPDHYYQAYIEGRTLGEIVREIMEICADSKIEDDSVIDFFRDYEQVRKHLCFRVINREKNRELLKDVPHISFLDLAVIFYCMIDSVGWEGGSIVIHNHHMEMWHVSRERLMKDAYSNTTKRLPIQCHNMNETLLQLLDSERLLQKEGVDELIGMVKYLENSMFVMSNDHKLHGASTIMYQDMREHLPIPNTDYYILPSSIHEVILIPVNGEKGVRELREMVQNVNETQLDPEEVLSDQVYFYSYAEDKISIAE